MKYVITNEDDVIIAISTTYRNDETIRNLVLDNYNIAYAPNKEFNVYQVNVPNEVVEQKYCYDETNGFYVNPNYVYYYSEEERISALEDMMNEIILGGVE